MASLLMVLNLRQQLQGSKLNTGPAVSQLPEFLDLVGLEHIMMVFLF